MGSTAQTQEMVKYDYHQYEVIGRRTPTTNDPEPKAYRIKLFCKNETQARSRFWYFIRKLVKMKKASAEILSVREVILLDRRGPDRAGVSTAIRQTSFGMLQNHHGSLLLAAIGTCHGIDNMPS